MKEKFIKKYCAGVGCFYHDPGGNGKHYCCGSLDHNPLFCDGVDISTLSACPRGKAYLKRILSNDRAQQRARKRKKLTPRKRQLLRDLRVGLIAGLVAGIVYLIEFVTLK